MKNIGNYVTNKILGDTSSYTFRDIDRSGLAQGEYTYMRSLPEENYSNVSSLDYGSILQMTANFRKSSGFDNPGHMYFRVLFDFDKTANLLSLKYDPIFVNLPWETENFQDEDVKDDEDSMKTNHTVVNTAFNYLLLNREWERARKLVDFVSLLSNIAKASPWYFTEIGGLDTALERKEFTEKDFKVEEQRKAITLKCLPDAVDNRIGTLLDLYRDITYSYALHKEIVPANLRKFDMGILIFNTPIMNLHRGGNYSFTNHIRNGAKNSLTRKDSEGHVAANMASNSMKPTADSNKPIGDKDAGTQLQYGNFASIDPLTDDTTKFKASVKYIELQNCEIMYNSTKEGYAGLNNGDGFQQNYTITILFDNAIEYRYNDQLCKTIGDMNITDMFLPGISDPDKRDYLSIQYSKDAPRVDASFQKRENSTSFLGTPSGNNLTPLEKLKQQVDKYVPVDLEKTTKGLMSSSIGYGIHSVMDPLLAKGKKMLFGNFYTGQPMRIIDTIGGVLSGNAVDLIEKGKKKYSKVEETNHRGWTVSTKKRFDGYTK